ncbi:10637_t:CDS:2 [Paraglomus occultum]|uniref:10637_t:CDS:1 n=1 Tax=Paraglomus occultum TaxID=144539 RepID=A0A9N8ZDA7_9GLOM|nr:10637_t:CDS:2 [Paraglomus occultum]
MSSSSKTHRISSIRPIIQMLANVLNRSTPEQPENNVSATTPDHAENSSSKANTKSVKQPFDYYICFDVEATCEEGRDFGYANEIIEFPAILIDSKTFDIVDIFHSYVKPSVNPKLSDFCISLTGISQAVVDGSPSFLEILTSFQQFLQRHKLFSDNKCAFITDGPWDIRDFIHKQCRSSNIERPKYFTYPWVDIRALFAEFYNCDRCNIPTMLSRYELTFEGRQHSGLDDAKNIAIIAKRMWMDGALFRANNMVIMKFGKRARRNDSFTYVRK